MFKNLFSFSRSQGIIIATLIVILVLGVLYFFVYVPHNQSNLEARQFRALQNTEQNISDKVDNSLALIYNLVRNYKIAARADSSANKKSNPVDKSKRSLNVDSLVNYINGYSKKDFILSINTNYHRKASADTAAKLDILTAYIKGTPKKNFALAIDINPRSKTNTNTVTSGETVPAKDTTISFNDKTLSIGIDSGNIQINITYTFKQFIDPLLPGDVFDQYIILSQSNVIYQSFPSGITQMIADSLKSKKSAFTNAQVKDVSLSGTDYKLFSQQLNLKVASPIIIAGLLTKQRYNDQKTELPEQAVLFLLLLAVATILALPWIKLYQMGNQDRMTAMDGLLCLAIPMLLMSVLFFAFFSYNSSFQDSKSDFEDISKETADSITRNFTKEIDSVYKVLIKAGSIYEENAITGSQKQLKDTIGITSQSGCPLNNGFKKLLSNIDINQLYQLDTTGMEMKCSWKPDNTPPPPGDFSNRDYFIRLKNHQPLYLDRNSDKPFYIEQVTSWTTGVFTTVMSIPHAGGCAPYTAMSFNLKSLDRPLLTPGFIYCIVNMQGKVLYHSITSKQLNENLTNEFSASNELIAALNAHSNKCFNTKYLGKQYNTYVSPFADLPYAVVIMEDKSYDNIRTLNNFIFSFSMLFAFFIVLALELIVVFVLSVKKHYYRKHYFDISWIGPDDRFTQEYKLAQWGNIVTIILLTCCVGYTPFLECLFMFLTASTLSFLFLTLLYARFYKTTDHGKYKLKMKAAIALAGIVGLLNIIAAFQTKVDELILFELRLLILLLIIWHFHKRYRRNALSIYRRNGEIKKLIQSNFNNRKIKDIWTAVRNYLFFWDLEKRRRSKKSNFIRSFSLMTFTRLIITSGLPVVLFYISIANYEIKLVTRYRHMQFAKEMQDGYLLNDDGIKASHRYIDHTWIYDDNIIKKTIPISYIKGDSCSHTLFKLLTTGDRGQIFGMNELDHTPTDSSWQYSSLFRRDTGITYCRLSDKSYLQIKSNNLTYKLPITKLNSKWYLGLIYWLLFFCTLAGFWLVLHYILKRLFALNLPVERYWKDIDTLLLEDDALNSLIFLIGTPGSGKLKKLEDLIRTGRVKGMQKDPVTKQPKSRQVNHFIADMILMPNDTDVSGSNDRDWKKMKAEALDPQYNLVIVNHFEYDIKNPISNRLKLNFLEELLQKDTSKVIIVSTVHPINFLDSLNSQQAGYQTIGTDREPQHDLERWHVLLGHFKIAIEKLNSNKISVNPNDPAWRKILEYETRSGHFLGKMRTPINTMLTKKLKDREMEEAEALSIKLGITAHYFYMYIWQSLTKEEKFLLYDLAEDGLVNPYDDYNLILLICKGLVIHEHGILKIFNHGFRNFILTAIGSTEAMQIQRQIKDNGNWSKLRMPLIILIVAVLVFLVASQQEAYTTLIKYLTAITVGVPAVLKIFSFFNSSESKAG